MVDIRWFDPESGAFLSIITQADGSTVVNAREAGTVVNGVRVCGVDCKPSEPTCNGYCRGDEPIPAKLRTVRPGNTILFTIPSGEIING